MWKVVLLLLLGALVGCSRELSNTPHVQLDVGFGLDSSEVLAGLDSWLPAGVVPEVQVVDHQSLLRNANVHADADTVYVVAVDEMQDCPVVSIYPGAATEDSHRGYAVTCIALQYLHSHGAGEFKRAAAHEFGHALGLEHAPESDSVMLNSYEGVAAPGCADFAHLASGRGTAIPEECK